MADCRKTETFAKEWRRMCKSYSECWKCPVQLRFGSHSPCSMRTLDNIDILLSIVQKWSDSNPAKTRQSMFLEMFPNAEIADDGIPYIYPCKLDANYEFSEDCKEFLGGFRCGMCKKEYWLAEVE